MGQIKVSGQQPPRLGSGVYYKDVPFQSEQQFTFALTDWISSFVSHKRAMHLVMSAAGFQDIVSYIQHAPTSLALPGKSTSKAWRCMSSFSGDELPISNGGSAAWDSISRIQSTT